MENQSDLKQIFESIRAFTQSPEYAQLQKAVTIYQDNMMELAKAVQPFQAPLQQLAVEICKGLAQLIEELRKQPEVDIEPLEELQDVIEVEDASIDFDLLWQNLNHILAYASWGTMFLGEKDSKDLAIIVLFVMAFCDIAKYISKNNSEADKIHD